MLFKSILHIHMKRLNSTSAEHFRITILFYFFITQIWILLNSARFECKCAIIMTWSNAKPVGTRANFEIRNVSVRLRYSLDSAFVQRHPTHITLFQSEKAIDREKSSYNCFDTFICKYSVMMYRFLGNSVKMLLKQLCYLNLSCRVHANKDIKTIVRFVKPLFSSKKLWLYVNQSVLPTNGN